MRATGSGRVAARPSVSHTEVGDVQRVPGDLASALGIREGLARADGGNAGWRRDLIVTRVKQAEATQDGARAWLGRAPDIARPLAASGRPARADAWMPGEFERRLAALPR